MKRSIVIKEIIEKKGYSLKKVSNLADMPYTTVCSMLGRGLGNSAYVNVVKLCAALGISPCDLETLAEKMD